MALGGLERLFHAFASFDSEELCPARAPAAYQAITKVNQHTALLRIARIRIISSYLIPLALAVSALARENWRERCTNPAEFRRASKTPIE